MKRFKFPLHRVLRLRAAEEESARRSLLQTTGRLRDLEQGLGSVLGRLQASDETSAAERAYGPFLAARAVALRRLAEEARVQVASLREAFLAKRRDRRSMEAVKDKEVARYAIETGREEVRDMEEIGRTRFSRTSAEEAP
jgi:flagellar FliJ protein